MMINDITSTLKQLILVNPYTYMSKAMATSLGHVQDALKGHDHNHFLLNHMIHSDEVTPKDDLQLPW